MMMVMVLHLIRCDDDALPKRRRVGREERGLAMLPGPSSLWRSEWIRAPFAAVAADDVVHGHTQLVCWLSLLPFVGTLHWPVAEDNLGRSGVSYVEMLILYV